MTDPRSRLAPWVVAAGLLLINTAATAAGLSPSSDLAKAAVESCTAAGEVSVAAVEARALAAGWPAFADEKVAGQSTRRSQWLVKGTGDRYSDVAILDVSATQPFEIPPGQKTVTCLILVPAPKVGGLMKHAAETHGVPLENGALFLKREAGKVRALTLMEMLDEFPDQAAKLKPGEQMILVAPNTKGKLGNLSISIVENPSGDTP